MRKEISASIILITFLFLAVGVFFKYINDNIISNLIRLSPGSNGVFTVFFVVLGIIWGIITLIIIIDNRRNKIEFENRQV